MGFFTSEAFTTEEARSSGFLWVFISLVTLRRPEGKEGRRREGGREGGERGRNEGGRKGGGKEEGEKEEEGGLVTLFLRHHQIVLYPW